MFEKFSIDVHSCARCEEDHSNIEFSPLTHPIESEASNIRWTHWTMCPSLNEPILLYIIQEE